jgi:hypothetical protein
VTDLLFTYLFIVLVDFSLFVDERDESDTHHGGSTAAAAAAHCDHCVWKQAVSGWVAERILSDPATALQLN